MVPGWTREKCGRWDMRVRKPISGVSMDGLWVTEAHSEDPYRTQLKIFPQRNGKAGNIFLPIECLFGWGVLSGCWIPALNFNWKCYPRTKESPPGREAKNKKTNQKAGVFNGCYQSISKLFAGAINVHGKELRGQRTEGRAHRICCTILIFQSSIL